MEKGPPITALLSLQPDSEVAEAGRCLEVFFEGWLKEIDLPGETVCPAKAGGLRFRGDV